MSLSRRRFLSLAAAAGASTALPHVLDAAAQPEDFSFLFLTDTHLEPELHATEGCSMAFKKA